MEVPWLGAICQVHYFLEGKLSDENKDMFCENPSFPMFIHTEYQDMAT